MRLSRRDFLGTVKNLLGVSIGLVIADKLPVAPKPEQEEVASKAMSRMLVSGNHSLSGFSVADPFLVVNDASHVPRGSWEIVDDT